MAYPGGISGGEDHQDDSLAVRGYPFFMPRLPEVGLR